MFNPMGSEREAEFIKRNAEHMESCKAKKSRIGEAQVDKLTKGQINSVVILEEGDFYPEPLQVRHPIVGWEIYT